MIGFIHESLALTAKIAVGSILWCVIIGVAISAIIIVMELLD